MVVSGECTQGGEYAKSDELPKVVSAHRVVSVPTVMILPRW